MSDENPTTAEPMEHEAPKATVKPETTQKAINVADYEDLVRSLRKENAKYRTSIEELSNVKAVEKAEELANKKLEELRSQVEETAKKNAEELLGKELAVRDKAARDRQLKMELKHQAEKAGVADWSDLFAVMKDQAMASAKFNDDGEAINAAELVAEIKAKKPHLFMQANTSSNTSNPPERMNTQADYRNVSRDDAAKILRDLGVMLPR